MNFIVLTAFLLLAEDEDDDDGDGRSWHHRALALEGRRRRDRRYPRASLKYYLDSPFKHLFDTGNEQALLNATGVDREEFNRLLTVFKPIFDGHLLDERTGLIEKKKKSYSGYKGRPRSIDAAGCLGMIQLWFRTTGPVDRSFPLIFGLTQTPVDRWLKFGRRCLFVALQQFQPTLPSAEKIEAYKHAIASKYQYAPDVAFAVDGCKMNIQAPTNDLNQSQFYNGWTHGHYVSNVFVFAPDGTIICAVTNAPGSFHDSTVADYGIYEKLEFLYDEYNAKTVADSAFIGKRPYLVLSGDDHGTRTAQELLLKRDATSIRQMAEWGMRQSNPNSRDYVMEPSNWKILNKGESI
jgi:hypothetical protein